MNQLCSAVSRCRLSSASSIRGAPVIGARRAQVAVARTPFVIFAADKKRTVNESALRRERTDELRRQRNKARKSAVSTRIKKVFQSIDSTAASVKSEADLAGVEKLISEAYSEIDKAVSKGILHLNNGSRKKARLATAKKNVLIKAGLYTPAI